MRCCNLKFFNKIFISAVFVIISLFSPLLETSVLGFDAESEKRPRPQPIKSDIKNQGNTNKTKGTKKNNNTKKTQRTKKNNNSNKKTQSAKKSSAENNVKANPTPAPSPLPQQTPEQNLPLEPVEEVHSVWVEPKPVPPALKNSTFCLVDWDLENMTVKLLNNAKYKEYVDNKLNQNEDYYATTLKFRASQDGGFSIVNTNEPNFAGTYSFFVPNGWLAYCIPLSDYQAVGASAITFQSGAIVKIPSYNGQNVSSNAYEIRLYKGNQVNNNLTNRQPLSNLRSTTNQPPKTNAIQKTANIEFTVPQISYSSRLKIEVNDKNGKRDVFMKQVRSGEHISTTTQYTDECTITIYLGGVPIHSENRR